MVCLCNIPYYLIRCDCCLKTERVEKNLKLYNGAQAVRSIGWSFGRSGRVLCKYCRINSLYDRYSNR